MQDLREWVTYHVELGVSRFYIYDNNSSMPLMNELTDFIKVRTCQNYTTAAQGKAEVFKVAGRGLQTESASKDGQAWLGLTGG